MRSGHEMPSVEKKQGPESEDKDKIILKVIVGRHGPKLSAEGEKNAKAAYFDDHVKEGFDKMDLQKGEGLAHVNTSAVQRAVDTADIHADELSQTDHRLSGVKKVYSKESLTVKYQPHGEAQDERYADDLETIMAMQSELKSGVIEAVHEELPHLDEKESEAEIRNRIDMEVLTKMFNDKSQEIFHIPFEEVADDFARRYAGFARHTDKLEELHAFSAKKGVQPKEEPYLDIDISHSYPVSMFLKKYLIFEDGTKASDLNSEEFFDRTGGIIRESGSFPMDLVKTPDGDVKWIVKAEFEKGKPFAGEIDMTKISELNPFDKKEN